MFYAANGKISKAREKRLLLNNHLTFAQVDANEGIEKACFGFMCFNRITPPSGVLRKNSAAAFAKVRAMTILYRPESINQYQEAINNNFDLFNSKWDHFLEKYKGEAQIIRNKFVKKNTQSEDSSRHETVSYTNWFNSEEFKTAALSFFNN